MPVSTLHGGFSVDFADVLLIINGFAIAMLFGVLYIDEILATLKHAIRSMNPSDLIARMRVWYAAARTPH